jgi:D-sedoheptulose 7-phosphate isomerase
MKDFIRKQIGESFDTKKLLYENETNIQVIEKICVKAIEIYQKGGKILLAGNGGSAADAQHIAGELVSRFYFDRPGLPALALTTDTSILTAIGNDYGYENLFSRQIEAYGEKGDLFIGISTSGNSKNIIRALDACRKKRIITVGLTGKSGGGIASLCDYCIQVPSTETPRIQETHILIGHIICAVIEDTLFGNKET